MQLARMLIPGALATFFAADSPYEACPQDQAHEEEVGDIPKVEGCFFHCETYLLTKKYL